MKHPVVSRMAVTMAGALALLTSLTAASGCKKKVTRQQCEELLDRYASLVIDEKMKGASPEEIQAGKARERDEAGRDDSFKNCTSELSIEDYQCAMSASSSDAIMKCVE